MIILEFLAGILIAIVNLIFIAIGGVAGLFELPKYLHKLHGK